MKKHGGRKLRRQYLFRKNRGIMRFKQQLNHHKQVQQNNN